MISKNIMKEIKSFYTKKVPFLITHIEHYQDAVVKHKSEFLELNKKTLIGLGITSDQDILANNIYHFILNILNKDFDSRISNLSMMIEQFIGLVEDKRLEKTIYDQIISYTFILLDKELNSQEWYVEFKEILEELFILDKKIIGLKIRHQVQTHISKKSKSLHVNSLHFLMISVSHMQNNLLSPVESQNRYYEKYVQADLENDIKKKEKILLLIEKNKTVFDKYKIFTQRLSTLFCTFESDAQFDNIKNIDFLYFLLDLVFVNGVNMKYKNTKLDVTLQNTQDVRNQHTIIYENVLIASIYALIENSIQSNATNITLDIHNNINSDSVEIFIKNNGDMIAKEDIKYLFYDHYSTKQQLGLGLSIVKRWLIETSADIFFVSSSEDETIFKITLPLWRT